MLQFLLNSSIKKPLKILCIGAHSDDIEIGCGGSLIKIFENYNIESVYWSVLCSNDLRYKEAEKSAQLYLKNIKTKTINIKDFRDGFLPYLGYDVKDYFEQIKKNYQPDLIFTHYRKDRHQDHRLICELTWNTFRNHFILEYEIPKYDSDLGNPNAFFDLNKSIVDKKIDWLMQCFTSQTGKHWFDELTFQSILRLRGMQCASSNGFAEAFYAEKIQF